MSFAKYAGYEALELVLDAALDQAAAGKGKERHAQNKPFDEQPMQLISDLLDSNAGMAFQAAKKIQEAMRMPFAQAERELLGAINYTAGIIIRLRKMEQVRKAHLSSATLVVEAPLRPYAHTTIPNWTSQRTDVITAELNVPEQPDTVPISQYNTLLELVESQQRRLAEVA